MNNQFPPSGSFIRPDTWAYWMGNSLLGGRMLPKIPEGTWNAGWPETSRRGILGSLIEPRGTSDRSTIDGPPRATSFNAGVGILGSLTQSADDLPASLSTPLKEQMADDPPMQSRSSIISGTDFLALLPRAQVESGTELIPTASKKGDQAECDEMHRRDLFHCKMVGLPSCYAQAYLRYTNCLNGRQIPPLNY